ncbi:heparin lyase I family protein [Streptomyces sp. NPDC005438]|uniref:heparin lyase I family protein n=1 Tax=Streptomyces sp. NPDC005438 TaxID=3156880 RepID=UPI0033BC112F
MERRTFLGLGAAVPAAVALGASATWAGTGPAHADPGPAADLLWAADLSSASDSYEAGFGNVQIQYEDGDIENDGPGMPVVEHPLLGRALRISLEERQTRYEARPGAAQDCGEGEDLYFRVDFVLPPDFPIDQDNPFCLVNQIHQGSDSGSPPVEFDVFDGNLSVRGDSDAYAEHLCPVAVDTVYSLVYRVGFSADPDSSLLEVWVNGEKLLSDFRPPCATMNGGNSYWKGATMYCSGSIPPLTVFQNAHRVGTTLESVTA